MKNFLSFIGLLLLTLLTTVLIAACNSSPSSQSGSPVDPTEGSPTQRIIQHAMGATPVPDDPQRVVVLDYSALEGVLALGVQPVGTVLGGSLTEQPAYLRDRLQGVATVGQPTQPNLEKILALQPDLILGSKAWGGAFYSQVSKIAPTVFTEDINENWKQDLMLYAEALNKTDVAEAELDRYYARLEEFKQQMGNRLQDTEVSIARALLGTVRLYLKDSFIGQILNDAGLRRPPSQDKMIYSQEISKEELQLADGDVVFVIAVDLEESAELEALKSDPLWSRLNAVQANQVYPVPGYWLGPGLISANLVIDDLFKYLINNG
jgi:iron complex transport system substrate-binding protein